MSARPSAPSLLDERKGGIRAPSFERCVAASVAAHLLFFMAGGRIPLPSFQGPSPVEIDLTSPLPGDGRAPKLGAPKRLIEKAPPVAPKPAEAPIPKDVAPTPTPPKDWTLPTGETKKTEAPPPPQTQITPGGAPEGTGTAAIPGGSGPGFNYGVPNGSLTGGSPIDVTKPVLLNGDELRRNLRKFYPEAERRAGREGSVVLYVHIDAGGMVTAAEAKASSSEAFAAAAEQVAKLMRFKPATRGGAPQAVVIAAPIEFRLKD